MLFRFLVLYVAYVLAIGSVLGSLRGRGEFLAHERVLSLHDRVLPTHDLVLLVGDVGLTLGNLPLAVSDTSRDDGEDGDDDVRQPLQPPIGSRSLIALCGSLLWFVSLLVGEYVDRYPALVRWSRRVGLWSLTFGLLLLCATYYRGSWGWWL